MDNANAKIYTKDIIQICSVPFSTLDYIWQYMISIPKYVAHQYVLLGKKIGQKLQNMSALIKKDLKIVRIIKETLTILVIRLQPYMTTLKKNTGYQVKTLLAIRKYWEQAFYNRFYQINEVLGSEIFFCCVRLLYRDTRVYKLLLLYRQSTILQRTNFLILVWGCHL